MPLWSANVANVAASPIHTNDKLRANTLNSNTLYGNVNAGVVYANMVFSLYGVSNAQANAAGFSANSAHLKNTVAPGWSVVRQWMGPAGNLVVTFAGNTYVNGQILTLTSTTPGTSNASAVIGTNSAGAITSLTMNNANPQGHAGLFVNTSTTTLGFTNSTGGTTGLPTGANIATASFNLFGRANRYSIENLVVLTSASANSTYNTVFFPLS